MASPVAGYSHSKPSFAKIAAMAVPQVAPKTVAEVSTRQSVNGHVSGQAAPTIVPSAARSGAGGLKRQSVAEDSLAKTPKTAAMPDLTNAISTLHIQPKVPRQDNSLDGSRADQPRASSISGDEQSHVSGSSSKLQSFDTKSIASATTFQMDEKESLRPDDSASVQAIDDNESSVNSRVGSELGPGTSKEQARERFSKRGPVILPSGAPRFGDAAVLTPGTLPQNPALRQMSFISGERIQTPDVPPPLSPDEKLLEAMSTPKDRLLLLQLEEKILTFVHQSKDEYFELPPQNSFGRMLAHKLADYYNLNHFVSNDISIVRVFRTTPSRLPPPLGSLAAQTPQSAQAPAVAGFKIMRRAGPNSGKTSANIGTPASSSAPSKATSEDGGDNDSEERATSPFDASTTKDKKLTREEREAQYEAARRRIFADLPDTTDPISGPDSSASMSRSSSTSGKKKNHRQRAPKDDSFEARSQFNAFYPGNYMPSSNAYSRQQGSMYGQGPYVPQQTGPIPASGYTNANVPFSGYEQTQTFNQAPQFNMPPSHFGQQAGWPMMPNDGSTPFYPSYDVSGSMGQINSQQASTMASPAMGQFSQPMNQYPNQPNAWMQTQYQNSYQQAPVASHSPPVHWPNYPGQHGANLANGPQGQYQYNQFQAQIVNSSPGSQQTMAAAFNRPTFNPQTRSFVPNPKAARFPAQSGQTQNHHNSPKVGKPYEQNGPSGTRSSNPSAAASRTTSQSSIPVHGLPGSNNNESLQKKWGTPSHLPPKPPPSNFPLAFDADAGLPRPNQQQGYSPSSNGPQRGNGNALAIQSGNSTQAYSGTAKVLAGGN